MKITPQQIKMLHMLYRHMGMDKEMHQCMLLEFTGQRTNTTKGLTFNEAKELISKLISENQEKQNHEAKRLVAAIYKLSLEISFLNKDYRSNTDEERKMNYAKINMFCRTRSRFKKNLTAMNIIELRETKKQFEAIARKENENG